MSRGYYNGGYNNMCDMDQRHHRYEEIPDIDPSMDFVPVVDDDASFYYMESPTRLQRGPDPADPAERSLLLTRGMHYHQMQQQQQQQQQQQVHRQATGRSRRNTPPSAERAAPPPPLPPNNNNNNKSNCRNSGDRTAAVTPCKARRRLDVYDDGGHTVSLPCTPSGGRSADVFAPMMAQTTFAGSAPRQPVTVRRARSSAALYNKHKRPPEFLSEYNLDTCVPATGVQYDRPRNTAVIQPIYKTSSSVFQVDDKATAMPESPSKPPWSRTPPVRTPVQSLPVCTLWTAAMVLVVSGTASCMLCFYLMSRRGRLYYLNAGLLAAAVCLALGFPGFRSQQWRWLPNRNYVTGYILVALFSALETCALWLMCQSTVLDPALNDIGAGVVCGISALSVTLACLGTGTSYCCRYPPPDNRVAHAVEGFVV